MSCELHDADLIETSAGAPAPARLQEHLETCAPCRRRLADAQAVLDGFDDRLRSLLALEPSPALAGRVAARLSEPGPARGLPPLRVLAIAAGVTVAILAGWFVGRRTHRAPSEPDLAAVSPRTSQPAAVTPATAVPSPSTASLAHETAPLRARPRVSSLVSREAGGQDPEVLVPPGQEEALRRFLANLRSGAVPAPSLLMSGSSVESLVQVPALTEIPLLETRPLADPGDSQERNDS